MTSFSTYNLVPEIIKSLSEQGIESPTEIQQKAIPILQKGGSDLLAISQTGTGKTLAFGIPLIQKIDISNSYLQALVLCPTRELAQQTAKQIGICGKYIKDFSVVAVYGGEDIEKQIMILDKQMPQVLVATPGRLLDMLRRDIIDFLDLSLIVLDEADEMLRIGFRSDIEYILSRVENRIERWMFCATMNQDIRKIADRFLEPGFRIIEINPELALNPHIEHQYLVCKPEQKREGMKYFLHLHADKNGIVFCRTKAAVDEIADFLNRAGYSVDSIHSDLSQKERDQVMRRFKNNEVRILVATDIAARGLDVKGLGFVIHYHLPEQREYFNHRSGRTGRAGNRGISLCLVFQREVKKINAIANNLGLNFTRVEFGDKEIEALNLSMGEENPLIPQTSVINT